VNAQVQNGQNVLITGIGGGVALLALQICIAKGANVYVTSGEESKIQKAISLGAKGGVNYKESTYSIAIPFFVSYKSQTNHVLQRAGPLR